MIATPKIKSYTAEEYLALEVEADDRHEYRNGEIVLMPGGTPAHNALTNALSSILWYELLNQDYQVFVVDQRLQIPGTNLYTYPDVMVIEEPVQLQTGRKDTVTNPLIIAEVLSESTKNYDLGDKFQAYQTIPSFQEYLLIDQYRYHVEHRVKQSKNQWLLTTYEGATSKLSLSSVPVEIEFSKLYSKVKFSN
ncbi:MAG: Uma2 family endonuclease [Cyanobacteria bacterium P01_D01_bin.36]